MDELVELLSGRGKTLTLDRAALRLAAIEFPELDPSPYLATLDTLADELGRRIGPGALGMDFVLAANQYLFEEVGFAGNTRDYHDPRNSLLNVVLSERTGIPISLAVVYMEVARRLGRPVYGISLPGHFLAQYNDGLFTAFIDPFHGGRILGAPECYSLARHASGQEIPDDPRFLLPVSNRQIVLRMAGNLRRAWFHRRCYGKAVRLLDVLIAALPQSADEYRQRAIANLQLGNMRSAMRDLEAYLRLAPEASDRGDIEKHVKSLKGYLVRLN